MNMELSPIMALMLAQSDEGAVVGRTEGAQMTPMAQDTPAPSTLFGAIDIPEEMAAALYENPELPARLGEAIGATVQRVQLQELDEGGPTYWPELTEETIAFKRQRGDAFPDEPLRGTGRMENELKAVRPEVLVEKHAEGILLTIAFPPYGGDMQPTERYGDLQFGSPATMEEEARFSETKNNTERGVVPPRPLGLDQRVRQNMAGTIEAFAMGLEPDEVARSRFNEQIAQIMAVNQNEEGYGVIPLIPEITQTRPQYPAIE